MLDDIFMSSSASNRNYDRAERLELKSSPLAAFSKNSIDVFGDDDYSRELVE